MNGHAISSKTHCSLSGILFKTTFDGAALVAKELRVHTLGADVSLTCWLLNAVPVLLARLVVCRMVL
jgi:hypothetical protein